MSQLPAPKRLFRAMKRAADQMPLCGPAANELGVRPGVDLSEDEAALVHPGSGGLSTTPDDPSLLPPHVRPSCLGGRGKLPVFVLYVVDMGPQLVARRDPARPGKHAFIEPSVAMGIGSLQELLCRTRGTWREADT